MAVSRKFEHLMSPGRIGSVTTRNRIIKTGAGTFMWHESETEINGAVRAFYESLARGGVGLLIVESPTIDYPRGARWRSRFRLDDDRNVKALSVLPEIIHRYGCPTFMQMNHDGPWQAKLGLDPDPPFTGEPIAASPVYFKSDNDFHNQMPRALTIEEIEELVDKFASAAVRAANAGFDGVDINAASSHLLHNFLSPFWNRRTDKYGGSVENRARFVTDIIRDIKKRLGNDFPVSVCINGLELGRLAGIDDSKCQTFAGARDIALCLQSAGADNIHVRSHWLGYHVGSYLTDVFFYPESPIRPNEFPPEYNAKQRGAAANVKLAAGLKKALKIPVMVVGRFDAELGEKAIADGSADFIGMTRRLQADPDYPNKIREGRLEDIAPCTACENCLGSRRCRINGFMGTEYNTIEKAKNKKKVVVIGGGPGGMEAARVAAIRGHDVSLYDSYSKIGGLLPVAAVVKGTELEDLPAIVRYFKIQLRKLGVTVNTGKKMDASAIAALKPDTVIIASGGRQAEPAIPGINSKSVVTSENLHKQLKFWLKFFSPEFIRRITGIWMPVGRRVVVIGSGLQGCEVAEFLTRKGRKVTIIDTAEQPGANMVDVLLSHLLGWFKRKGVSLYNGVKDITINDEAVSFIDASGTRRIIPADTVIPALLMVPDPSLAEALAGEVPEVISIGDCAEPGLIADAIGTALRTVRNV